MSSCFADRTRILILFLSMFSLTIVLSNSQVFNFTVICMQDVVEEYHNTTSKADSLHWLENPADVNSLFSAVAIGSIIGNVGLVWLIHKIGLRNTMGIYGLSSGIATLLFPLAVRWGYWAVFVARAVQGTCMGVSFTSTGAIAASWSSLREAGTYIAWLSSHVQLSNIFTMPLAGVLCESSFGWRWLYYIQGVLTVSFFGLFIFYFRDHPATHRSSSSGLTNQRPTMRVLKMLAVVQRFIKSVSSNELRKISAGKTDSSKREPVPYRAVSTSGPIIGVWLSCIGGNLGFLVLLYYGPTYMNKVLGFDVKSTGMATALPYVLSAAIKFTAGPLSDYSTCLSDKARILLFACLSQGIMAICFVILSQTTSALLAQMAYTVTIMFSGLNVVGVIKCAQLVARHHIHFVLSVISMAGCIISFLIPLAVSIFVPDGTPEEWGRLFLYVGIILALVNVPFIFLAESEPAEWTKPRSNKISDEKPEKTVEKQSSMV